MMAELLVVQVCNRLVGLKYYNIISPVMEPEGNLGSQLWWFY